MNYKSAESRWSIILPLFHGKPNSSFLHYQLYKHFLAIVIITNCVRCNFQITKFYKSITQNPNSNRKLEPLPSFLRILTAPMLQTPITYHKWDYSNGRVDYTYYLFTREFRSVRKDKIDSELRRDWRWSSRSRSHERRWSFRWVHIGNHFLPSFREAGICNLLRLQVGCKWTAPPHRGGSGEESRTVTEHCLAR